MLLDATNTLVASLLDLRLVSSARRDELHLLAESFPTASQLAAELERRRWLTPFQIQQLLQGRGPQLRIGPYVLLDRIGASSTGEVFQAREPGHDRLVALKVLRIDYLPDAKAVHQFLWDAEAAQQVTHPHLVTIHDADADGETVYLALEYVEGTDPGRLLHQAGPFPVRVACDFVRQAALGLHHAHERGLLHRDLKPSNLLVLDVAQTKDPHCAGGTVKVLDVGLARPRRSPVLLGTLDYLAPEQVTTPDRVDRRADLYSLGCTLYHLLAGRPPFPGGTPTEKLRRHQAEEPVPLTTIRPDVPAELDELVRRLLAKSPADRPATAFEVAELLADVGQMRFVPREVLAPPEPVRRSPRRLQRWAVVLGGLVVLSSLAALPLALVRPEPEGAQPVAEVLPEDCAGVMVLHPRQLLAAPASGTWLRGVDVLLETALPAKAKQVRLVWRAGESSRPVVQLAPRWEAVALRDERLAAMLEQEDRKSACWFVLALDRLGAWPAPSARLEPPLRALVEASALVQGSVSVAGEEVEARVCFVPREDRLAELERAIRQACQLAREADGWPGDFPTSWAPVVRLVKNARIERGEREIVLGVQLPGRGVGAQGAAGHVPATGGR